MNALTAAFPNFKGVSFKPNWKTLTILDDNKRWYGRVLHKHQNQKKSDTHSLSPQPGIGRASY